MAGLLARAMSEVAGPLAERTFHLHLFLRRWHFTFDGDLGRRRDRQAGELAANHIDGRAAQAAVIVEFGHAIGHRLPGDEKQQRFLTEGYGHWAALAFLPKFLARDARVMPG